MITAGITSMQARFAQLIGHIQIMQFVSHARLFNQFPRPSSCCQSVGWKIQHHGHSGLLRLLLVEGAEVREQVAFDLVKTMDEVMAAVLAKRLSARLDPDESELGLPLARG